MSGIEFLYQEGVKPCSKEPLKVRLDGRIVGEIRKVDSGYQYWPKGVTRSQADVFEKLDDCAKSLTAGG